jgi:hypothetical protein
MEPASYFDLPIDSWDLQGGAQVIVPAAGSATAGSDTISEGPRYVIRANDIKYVRLLARVALGTGIKVLRTPYGAPKVNAICERFLGSVRRVCLDQFLILSERHLYRAMREYQEYFNRARPHQGIGHRIPGRLLQRVEPSGSEQIVSRPPLGGLHHDYQWRAAGRSSYAQAA